MSGPTNGKTVTQMIIQRLDRIEDKVDELIKGQVALKVKVAIYGGAAGFVVAALTTLVIRLAS